jgi:hypothetical protein
MGFKEATDLLAVPLERIAVWSGRRMGRSWRIVLVTGCHLPKFVCGSQPSCGSIRHLS